MRIGIDMRMAGNRNGGIGRYVLELASHILAFDQKNEYWLICHEENKQEIINKLSISRHNAHFLETDIRHYTFGEQTRLPRLLEKYNLDLAHFPNFNAPIFYKRPFIITIHDVIHHKLGGVKKANLFKFAAYKKVIKNAGLKAMAIITVSQASKKEIRDTLNIPENKISVIYEGGFLPTQVSQAEIEKIKESFLLHRPYFLFVGVLQRNKNLISLSRGFDAFLNLYGMDYDLVIAGRIDPHYPDIKYQAMDISNSSRLVFTGFVEDKALACLYAGARAFVSASIYEGFGLPGVEAMRFGLPLAVSNIEVFNEIYDNAAIYFKPNDPEDIAGKLRLLAQDENFYQKQKIQSFQRGEFFSWQECARKTLEIYQQSMAR